MAMIGAGGMRETLDDIIGRVVPERAANQEALERAAAYSLQHTDEVIARAAERYGAVNAEQRMAQREARARFIMEELVAIRDKWLKDHGLYNSTA
jgi:hypothetical protein